MFGGIWLGIENIDEELLFENIWGVVMREEIRFGLGSFMG